MRTLPLLVLAACGPDSSGTAPPPPTETDPTGTNVTTTVPGGETVRPPSSDEGSIVLLRRRSPILEPVSYIYAAFLDDAPSALNLAQCIVTGAPCIEVLPTEEDTWVTFDDNNYWDFPNPVWRYVGAELIVGDYTLPYLFNPAAGTGYYAGFLTAIDADDDPLYGDLTIELSGEWAGHLDEDDPTDDPVLYAAPDLDLIQPDYKSTLDFVNGAPLLFEWTPLGDGEVYLIIEALGVSRLYWLEDDGFEEIDVDDLGLGDDDLAVTITMGRWTHRLQNVGPHVLDAVSASEIVMNGTYHYVGSATPLFEVNTCANSDAMEPITESGVYWGEFGAWYTDDLTNITNCPDLTFPWAGEEGMFPIRLEANSVLTLEYSNPDGDAAVYLLSNCSKTSSCIANADLNYAVGGPEYLTYFNQTDEAMELTLVLDGYIDALFGDDTLIGDIFTLDLTIDVLEEPEMYDECLDAQLQTEPMGEGTYYTETFPFTGTLNPGLGGCTGTSLPGPESMTQIRVEDGETLTATLSMTDGDGAIYLMYNCINVASCIIGSDLTLTGPEAVGFTNLSGAPTNVYMVVDSKDQLGPYILTVDIAQ